MPNEKSIGAGRVLEIAETHQITRGGLQAQVKIAEASGAVDQPMALAAMRALLDILERAEQSFAVARDSARPPMRMG